MSLADLEPLVTDARLARAERVVRLLVPALPEDSVMVTARDEQAAIFMLISQVPGLPPEFSMQTLRRVPLEVWDAHEKARGHYVSGGSDDPVAWVFERLARDQTQRLSSAAEMIHPEEA